MPNKSTAMRRERVRELWGKRDRIIAEILYQEDYVEKPAHVDDRTYERLLDQLRRNINNDRTAIRNDWRSGVKQLTFDDLGVTRLEYIAKLQTRIYDLEEVISSAGTKPTAKVNAFAEIRMLEQAIGKAQGAEQMMTLPDAPGAPGADAASGKPIGVILDTSVASAETRAALREQGYDIPEPGEA